MVSNSSHSASLDALILFAASVVSTLVVWKGIQSNKAPKHTDKFYLDCAHHYRLQLKPPIQSHFRVVAILLLENGQLIYGTNDEPSPNISLSMCAERCAFLRYHAQQRTSESPVKVVYIVTDADTTVAPGTACREYMYGHPATTPKTRVVLQSRDPNSNVLCTTLAELIPYPSLFVGMTPEEQLNWGQMHQSAIRKQLETFSDLKSSILAPLVQAARKATEMDQRENVHAIRYGAAVALEIGGEIEILQAAQVKALEYSSSLDAVGQLAGRILNQVRQNNAKVVAVVQVDQFGIPHGLFAQARAFFVEHGFGGCMVVLTAMDEGGSPQVKAISARELSPLVPEFRS